MSFLAHRSPLLESIELGIEAHRTANQRVGGNSHPHASSDESAQHVIAQPHANAVAQQRTSDHLGDELPGESHHAPADADLRFIAGIASLF